MALTPLDNTPLVAGQSGIERYSVAVSGGTQYVTLVRTPNGQVLGVSSNFVATGSALPDTQLATLNATTGSLPVGAITGAGNCTLISSNAVPGAQLVRTAAQMLADTPGGAIGLSWNIRITNTGAGTLTLTTDAGATVTLVGTMTVPQNTVRTFVGTFNTATTATITATGTGTYS